MAHIFQRTFVVSDHIFQRTFWRRPTFCKGVFRKAQKSRCQMSDSGFVILAFVNVAPVADMHDEDDNGLILDLSEQANITDTIAPCAGAVGGQCFAVPPGIGRAFKVLTDPAEDESGLLFIELFQGLHGSFGKFYMVMGHLRPSILSASSSE